MIINMLILYKFFLVQTIYLIFFNFKTNVMPVPGSLKRVVILLYKIMTCLIITEQTTRMKINLSNNI